MENVASSGNLPFKVTAVAAGEAHTLLLTGNQLSILVHPCLNLWFDSFDFQNVGHFPPMANGYAATELMIGNENLPRQYQIIDSIDHTFWNNRTNILNEAK